MLQNQQKQQIMLMNKKSWIASLLLLCAFNVFSQTEEFFILGQNDTLIKANQSQMRLKSLGIDLPYTSLLSLPFYDDFARQGVYPYKTFWADQNVYINNSFCTLPPSINVATFDALGYNGLLHKNASSMTFAADTLTSQPFNLKTHPVTVASNLLYRKNTLGSFERISDSLYYKADTFKVLSKSIFNYFPSDTLYRVIKTDIIKNKKYNTYEAIDDSIYTKTNTGYVYLQDSKSHKKAIVPYSASDNIYLTFAVQPGGVGDKPEAGDSLFLECYAPYDTNKVVINEVASSWIEFFNGTDSVVNIAGYYLFNDTLKNIQTQIDSSKGTITKQSFMIPNNGSCETRIPPQGLLMIDVSSIKALKNFNKQIIVLCKDTLAKNIVDSIYISDTSYRMTASYGRPKDGDSFDNKNALAKQSKNTFNGTWKELWSISSENLQTDLFYNQIVPIDKSFFKKGFRFRFINYASLSSDKSHARNEDQWNLDMVNLFANRNPKLELPDERIRKVDFNFYGDYTSIPFKHVLNIDENTIQSYLTYTVQNTDTIARAITYHMSVKEQAKVKDNKITANFSLVNTTPQSQETADLSFIENISLYEMFVKNAKQNMYSNFDISFFYTDNESPIHEQYRWNDTIHLNQSFYNFYSYDDGSSEAGYGIRGIENAQVAYAFSTLQTDTLHSVIMYFNNTLNTDIPSFNLCVWDDNNGKPGKLIAKQAGEYVKYADGVNKFSIYPIKQESIIDASKKDIQIEAGKTFYIGWLQPTDVLINIGVDLNRTVKNKIFYKTGTAWQSSLLNNPLMIRPVFDDNPEVVKAKVQQQTSQLEIYPNPSTGICSIVTDTDNSSFEISVKSIVGQEIVHQKGTTMIDLSNVQNGLYFITMTNKSGTSFTGKVIIQH